MTDKNHALLSASASHKWLNCTPSAKLEEMYEEVESDYAKEGTLAHELAELKLKKDYKKLSTRTYNASLKKLKEDPMYNEEMDNYTDYYKTIIDELMMSSNEETFLEIEKMIDYGNWAKEGFGTADCLLIYKDVLHIVDLKYGKGVPVSAEKNPQLMLYALGALDTYGLIYPLDVVQLTIVQPRLDNISSYTISVEDLKKWGNEIVKPQAGLAFEGSGEFKQGEWCRFCKAKGDCRERAVVNLESISKAKKPVLNNAEISCALTLTTDVVDWIKDLKETALKKILAGEEIPGYKAVEGKSNRTITDIDALFKVLIDDGTEEALLYERKPLTLTALEKLVGKTKFNELAKNYIDKPKGAPTLAKEMDKREKYVNGSTAAEDFKI